MGWALNHPTRTSAQKLVLVLMAGDVDQLGRVPADLNYLRRLAARSVLGIEDVERAIRVLVRVGTLERGGDALTFRAEAK